VLRSSIKPSVPVFLLRSLSFFLSLIRLFVGIVIQQPKSTDKKTETKTETKDDTAHGKEYERVAISEVDNSKLMKKVDDLLGRIDKNKDNYIQFDVCTLFCSRPFSPQSIFFFSLFIVQELKNYFKDMSLREIRGLTSDLLKRDQHKHKLIRAIVLYLNPTDALAIHADDFKELGGLSLLANNAR
jgi:hypothetical protein